MTQNPRLPKTRTAAAIAIPTFAPRLIPDVDALWDDAGVLVGEVMLTCMVENKDPSRETICPGVGCCKQAPSRAVKTFEFVSKFKSKRLRMCKLTVVEIQILGLD